MIAKKTAVLLCAAMLALLLAVSAAAGDLFLTDVTAEKAEKTPVIDGVFDPEEGWGDPVIRRDSSDMKDYAETDPGFEALLDDPAGFAAALNALMIG